MSELPSESLEGRLSKGEKLTKRLREESGSSRAAVTERGGESTKSEPLQSLADLKAAREARLEQVQNATKRHEVQMAEAKLADGASDVAAAEVRKQFDIPQSGEGKGLAA